MRTRSLSTLRDLHLCGPRAVAQDLGAGGAPGILRKLRGLCDPTRHGVFWGSVVVSRGGEVSGVSSLAEIHSGRWSVSEVQTGA